MDFLDAQLNEQLAELQAAHRMRRLYESEVHGATITVDGKPYIQFSGNDYLGLSQHPKVIESARDALERYGAGAGASRLITGSHPLYAVLQREIAMAKGTEVALVFGSGYLTNIGLIPALASKGDLILADRLSHACMIDGIRLSGATFKRFKHNDVKDLAQLLSRHRKQYKRCFILTEHVFSMDGDVAPLEEIVQLARTHTASVIVDDAHGFGVLPTPNLNASVIWMGTLSKAAGAYGGYVAASQTVIDTLISSARSMLFSTGLPPAVIAAATESVKIIRDTRSQQITQLMNNIKYLSQLSGLNSNSAIFPLHVGAEKDALRVAEELRAKGCWVQAIRPPTVPEGTSRIRITISALHTRAHLDQLSNALAGAGLLQRDSAA